ncbi:MAG: tetratricopeptide repeat protein [Treponema sp.]|nr:tetratricopeptide repeat protein [Treponema sp.]
MPEVVELKCPGCGARVQIDQKECEWCHSPIIVSSMSDIFKMSTANVLKYSKSYESDLKENPGNAELNNSLAMCYLNMGFYERALEKFNKAIEQDLNNPETYFYAAVCVLAGRKPFLTPRPEIDKIEKYINAALMIEENGLFRYFQAYIKYDYFKRKFFKTSPTWEECFAQAKADGFSPSDVNQLFSILKQEKPSCM